MQDTSSSSSRSLSQSCRPSRTSSQYVTNNGSCNSALCQSEPTAEMPLMKQSAHTAAAATQACLRPSSIRDSSQSSSSALSPSPSQFPATSPYTSSSGTRSRSRRPQLCAINLTDAPTSPTARLAPSLSSPPLSPSGARSRIARILELQESSQNSCSAAPSRKRNLTFSAGQSPLLQVDELVSAYPDYPTRTARHNDKTDPSAFLSRSTSLQSERTDQHRNCVSKTRPTQPSELHPLGLRYDNEQDWSARARRWSTSMSRKMSISTLNQSIASTSPYLRAGLDELKSIFDVESIGVFEDDSDERLRYRVGSRDLEGRPSQDRESVFDDDLAMSSRSDSVSSGVPETSLGLCEQGSSSPSKALKQVRPSLLFDSPLIMSEHSSVNLSRHPTTSSDAGRVIRRSGSIKRTEEAKAGGSTGIVTEREMPMPNCQKDQAEEGTPDVYLSPKKRRALALQESSFGVALILFETGLGGKKEGKLSTSALVAVGLTATAVGVAAVCLFEASMHPDAASFPLVVFMLAQPAFAILGLAGLLLQKRWLMDLASRLLRAHVLCQGLIALAALRHLSQSAFYRRSSHSWHWSTATTESPDDQVQQGQWHGSRISRLISSQTAGKLAFDPATTPHQSGVGSLRDQLTYLVVFGIQATLPLLLIFWAQYRIAMKLAWLTRMQGSSFSQTEEKLSRQRSIVRKHSSMRRATASPPVEKTTAQSMQPPPAPILDFKLDPVDLSSRLENLSGSIPERSSLDEAPQATAIAGAA